jgi:hypothetical protein
MNAPLLRGQMREGSRGIGDVNRKGDEGKRSVYKMHSIFLN